MNFEPFLVYSASAGSGKTFALSLRYISLLFFGESPSNILASTFTRKAASQMQSRVRDYLLNLEQESDFLELLSIETGFSKEELLKKKQEVLSRFLSSTNYIITIDSFIASILRTNALEIGLEPNFNTVDSLDVESEFIQNLYQDGLLDEFVELTLMMEQKRNTLALNTMIELFSKDPLLPQKIEQELFNQRELEEMIDTLRERIYDTLKSLDGISKSAVKNFAPAPIKEFYQKGMFEKDSLHQHRFYKKALSQAPVIDEWFGELKKLIKMWLRARENQILLRLFRLYDEYKNSKISKIKATSTLSFDDISYFAYRLLHKTINREFLYFKLDSRFRHILIDEFQDTSTLQFLIFKPLIDEIFSGGEEFRSFFYVGDPKQSLYRFRGGQEELFEWVAKHYQIPIRELDTNYRSYRLIVESVNRWFEGVMPNYTPQKTNSKKSGYIKVLSAEDVMIEAISEAKALIKKGVDPSSIAFLLFTNNEGLTLQNLSTKESLSTILQTSSKLNRLSKVLALVTACEYLYRGYEIDLYNLLLRVGVTNLEGIDFGWFHPKLRPVEVLDNLIRVFDYFEDESNILNLLEFASKFSEIGEFLEEFEKSRLPIATKSQYGSTIMTIHNSKGLEFDYVIVLDRTKREKNSYKKLLERYDENLHIERLFYKFSKRENFDQSYKELIAKNQELEQKDRLNVLYVALTRAKKGLIVIKSEKNSIFERELNIESIEIGEVERESFREDLQNEVSYPPLSRYGSQEVEEIESEREFDYFASLFGSAMHYTLEMMREFSKESLELAIEATKNRFGAIFIDNEIADIKDRVLLLLKNREFQSLLSGAKIKKEQPISYQGELYQIDLLLEFEDEMVVIDYKSSKNESYKHKKQVLNYCKIVSKVTKKSTKGFICYLLRDSVEIVRV